MFETAEFLLFHGISLLNVLGLRFPNFSSARVAAGIRNFDIKQRRYDTFASTVLNDIGRMVLRRRGNGARYASLYPDSDES